MSQRALAVATLSTIRTALSLATTTGGQLTSDVMFDGQPAPGCGEWFYAVHAGEWRGDSGSGDHLSELIGINVTVTRRVGFAPQDRWGPEAWAKASTGLDEKLRTIVATVHKSYAILNAANTLIGNTPKWGFDEPLMFLSGGKPEPKGPDWFSAEEAQTGKVANAGIAQTLTFGGARRVHDMTQMS